MAKGVYSKHRASQEEWIIEVAEKLFITQGIENVKMNDIASHTRLTKPTLYKYFSSKEEVAVQIFQRVAATWDSMNREKVWSKEGTGFEKVERFVHNYFDHHVHNVTEARFVAEFDQLYAKKWSVDEAMNIIRTHLENDNKELSLAVDQGQSDGSVRQDIEAEVIVSSIFNFNSGMVTRLGMFGDKLSEEFDLELINLYMKMCHIFLDGLKAV